MRFYTGRRNATNKSCLFDAKFFEFEEFSIDTFFCSSIQPQHAVYLLYHRDLREYMSSIISFLMVTLFICSSLGDQALLSLIHIFVSGGFGTNKGPIKNPRAFPSSNITQEMPIIIKKNIFYLGGRS